MKLSTELFALAKRLDEAGIPYAVCGGLAMAAHGWPRATMDIDLLIEEASLEGVRAIAHELGFSHDSGEIPLAGGGIRLHRLVKFEGKEFVPLDLILVGPALQRTWESRRKLPGPEGDLSVVSTEGLIEMKKLRGSGTDQDDIGKLEGKT